jgi:hypothetical protein
MAAILRTLKEVTDYLSQIFFEAHAISTGYGMSHAPGEISALRMSNIFLVILFGTLAADVISIARLPALVRIRT